MSAHSSILDFGGTDHIVVNQLRLFGPATITNGAVVFYPTSSGVVTCGLTANIDSGTATVDVNLSGPGLVSKEGTGTLFISGENTYSGTTTITGGKLQTGKTGSLASGTSVSITGAGILDLNTFSQTIGALTGTGTVDTEAGGSPTLEIGLNNTGGTFSGVIKNTEGDLSLVKTGSGTQTLSGDNMYTGNTTISGGTLALGVNGSIATSATVVIGAGAVLDVSAKNAFAMATEQSVTFVVDPSGEGAAGRIAAQALDITNGDVRFSAAGALKGGPYVLATYTSLTGDAFAAVTALPYGWTIDYTFNDGTAIALKRGIRSGMMFIAK